MVPHDRRAYPWAGESSGRPTRTGDSLRAMSDQRTILTVHAHPDDEASKGAPTLAKYHAEGVRTILVCCTGGEEGDLQNPPLREPGRPFHELTPEQEQALVASMRAAELAKSAAVIGFDEVVMLGYRDSGMADSESNQHPDCFHQADLDESTGRLVDVIRRTRPQVIITYNDDQAGVSAPRPSSRSTTSRCWRSSVPVIPSGTPSSGEPYQPLKLYYTTWSRRRLVAVHEGLLRHRGESPFDETWLERPDNDHRVTTHIEIGDFMWARTQSLQAHATQVDPTAAFWFGLSDDELAEVYPWEDWILARSLVGEIPVADDGDPLENDLFAGIEASAPVVEAPT